MFDVGLAAVVSSLVSSGPRPRAIATMVATISPPVTTNNPRPNQTGRRGSGLPLSNDDERSALGFVIDDAACPDGRATAFHSPMAGCSPVGLTKRLALVFTSGSGAGSDPELCLAAAMYIDSPPCSAPNGNEHIHPNKMKKGLRTKNLRNNQLAVVDVAVTSSERAWTGPAQSADGGRGRRPGAGSTRRILGDGAGSRRYRDR